MAADDLAKVSRAKIAPRRNTRLSSNDNPRKSSSSSSSSSPRKLSENQPSVRRRLPVRRCSRRTFNLTPSKTGWKNPLYYRPRNKMNKGDCRPLCELRAHARTISIENNPSYRILLSELWEGGKGEEGGGDWSKWTSGYARFVHKNREKEAS